MVAIRSHWVIGNFHHLRAAGSDGRWELDRPGLGHPAALG
jgi:hypothetical protein